MVLYLPVSGRNKRLGLNKLFSARVDSQIEPCSRDTAWAITQRDKGARASGVVSNEVTVQGSRQDLDGGVSAADSSQAAL